MTKEMIWSLPQVQEFLEIDNKSDNLGEVVWSVLGGIPARYEKIWKKFKRLRLSYDTLDTKQLIGELLCDEVYTAIKIVEDSKTDARTCEIIELFDKEMNGIIAHQLTLKKLIRPTPDKVFHDVNRNGKRTLVPASSAIGIVLRHNLTETPTFGALERMVQSTQT
jgi:hypothetical protein